MVVCLLFVILCLLLCLSVSSIVNMLHFYLFASLLGINCLCLCVLLLLLLLLLLLQVWCLSSPPTVPFCLCSHSDAIIRADWRNGGPDDDLELLLTLVFLSPFCLLSVSFSVSLFSLLMSPYCLLCCLFSVSLLLYFVSFMSEEEALMMI